MHLLKIEDKSSKNCLLSCLVLLESNKLCCEEMLDQVNLFIFTRLLTSDSHIPSYSQQHSCAGNKIFLQTTAFSIQNLKASALNFLTLHLKHNF